MGIIFISIILTKGHKMLKFKMSMINEIIMK
jgi:hypothetical protein